MASYGGLDDNPFAPPPVNNPPINNAPAVLEPTTTYVAQPTNDVLDDFNPFTPTDRASKGSTIASAISTKELDARAAELDRREREQSDRERRLRDLEQGGTPRDVSGKNWPPLPSSFPIRPCFYQDIEVEIPQHHQPLVRIAYGLWVSYFILMLLNLLGGIILLFTDVTKGATVFGFALIYGVLFVPASYICWFRPLYRAFRSDSSFNFFWFFFVFFAQIIVVVFMALGVPINSCGWLTALPLFGSSIFAAIVLTVVASLFTAWAVVSTLIMIRIHRAYRHTDASFDKAKAEFSQGVFSNQTVRDAAVSGVRSGFTS